MGVHEAAAEFGSTASTLYRRLNDGFVAGEQITPTLLLTSILDLSEPCRNPP